MKVFAELRMLAWMKRIALALEEANRLEKNKQVRPVRPKLASFEVASAEDWNERYQKDMEAKGLKD